MIIEFVPLINGDSAICQFYLDMTGLPTRSLAYDNSRFCIFKFTKPVHEHHMQVFANASQAYILHFIRTLRKSTTPNAMY
jgi:hypothetical protein